MSQASGLQKPLIFVSLLLIDLLQLSIVAKAMRPYPTFTPPQSWTQYTPQHSHNLPAAVASSSLHQQRDTSDASSSHRQHNSHTPSSPNNHEILSPQGLNCGGVASSSSQADCSRSPAPEEAAGSEIDPRYGVEKRLVPTGPNPLHN